jgi:hypothetical protein
MIVPAVQRAEAVWLRILGVLLILLGLALLASPEITYTTREQLPAYAALGETRKDHRHPAPCSGAYHRRGRGSAPRFEPLTHQSQP